MGTGKQRKAQCPVPPSAPICVFGDAGTAGEEGWALSGPLEDGPNTDTIHLVDLTQTLLLDFCLTWYHLEEGSPREMRKED